MNYGLECAGNRGGNIGNSLTYVSLGGLRERRIPEIWGLEAEIEIFFFFFFFHWHCSPLWALACRTMSFHFFPICHQLCPSSHSQHLKISFYFLFPSFPGSSPSRPFQFLSEGLFGHSILLHSLSR